MDEDVKAKLTAAWRAAVARLIEAGYEPADVYATMISVGLSGAEDRANDNPRPSGEVRHRTDRSRRPLRIVVLGALDWSELSPAIRPSHFTVDNLPTRLRHLGSDPWAEIGSVKQSLPSAAPKKRRQRADHG
jgi:hypothetical protein